MKEIDLPAGMTPGSPEALAHMLGESPIHQGTLTDEPETPPVLPGTNQYVGPLDALDNLILGLEMVLAHVKEMRDDV